jgi:hypothetical protein
MRATLARFGVLVAVFALAAAATLEPSFSSTTPPAKDPSGLVVHEWGTFTSIAGKDGRAVEWMPQNGPSDLPCFVHRLRFAAKGFLVGTVRMETPVLYFYSPNETTVKVRVQFRQGVVSEWFPAANVSPKTIEQTAFNRRSLLGTIEWPEVKVTPGAAETFRTESRSNHYYAARATDAAPVRVGTEQEKFLFYRGVGNFSPPISATIAESKDGQIAVVGTARQPLGDLVLFENRGGNISYRMIRAVKDTALLQGNSPRGDVKTLYRELEKLLVQSGLYQKEAAAMVETWRDSWFEEGTRLLYIVPKQSVEAILPLQITPKPAQVERVFVGRLELITAQMRQDVRAAILNGDVLSLKKYGRFFQPIVNRLRAEGSSMDVAALDARLPRIYGSWGWSVNSCR